MGEAGDDRLAARAERFQHSGTICALSHQYLEETLKLQGVHAWNSITVLR